MKHIEYILLSVLCLLFVGCKDSVEPVPSKDENQSSQEVPSKTTEIVFTPSGDFHQSAGVYFFDSSSELVNLSPIEAVGRGDGSFSCSISHPSDLEIASFICVSPYQAFIKVDGNYACARLFGGQRSSDSVSAVSFGRAAVAANSVSFSELTIPGQRTLSELTEVQNPHLLILDFGKNENGVLTIGPDGGKLFHSRYCGTKVSLCFDGPLSDGAVSYRLFGEDVKPEVALAVTSDKLIEGETAKDARSWHFLQPNGKAAAVVNSGKVSLVASDGSGNDVFNVENAELRDGMGLILKCDDITPGSVEVPTIDEKQITRIICALGEGSDPVPHTVWLEVFDGRDWGKVPGMEFMANPDPACVNGGVLDFVIPKKNVSVAGVYRLCTGAGTQTTVIRSVTVVYEDESCSHDPRSIITDDYKGQWVMAGTSSNPDNNFIREDLIILDTGVSHVDDGSGSLRLGGLACINNFKPWIGWKHKDVTVEPGATYRVYFCVKTENMPASANLFLSLGFKDSSKQWISGWIPGAPTATSMNGSTSLWADKIKGTHDWMKISADVTAPDNAVTLSYFQFMLQSVIYAPDAFAWFDDINAVKIK